MAIKAKAYIGAELDIEHYQGDVFDITLEVFNEDGTDFSFANVSAATLKVKTHKGASTNLADLTLANGDFSFSANSIIFAAGNQSFAKGTHVQDMELTYTSGAVRTVFFGKWIMLEQV